MVITALADRLLFDPPLQMSGKIISIQVNDLYVVESEGRAWHSRKAASCLLQPEIGDTVLLANTDDNKLWLLAVLERANPENSATLRTASDLQICSDTGVIKLVAEQQLELNSQQISVLATQAYYNIDTLRYQGKEISAWVSVNTWMGDRYQSIWNSTTQISDVTFRQSKQIEHVRAGQLDFQAEDYARLHARNTMITADDITQIDSTLINVG